MPDDRYPTDVRAESSEPYCLACEVPRASGFGDLHGCCRRLVFHMAGRAVIRTEALRPLAITCSPSTSFELQDESRAAAYEVLDKQSTSSPRMARQHVRRSHEDVLEEAWVDEFQGHFPGTYRRRSGNPPGSKRRDVRPLG